MTTEPTPRLDGLAGTGPAAGTVTPTAPAGPDGTTFQRLLESLQQLRATGRAVTDLDAQAPEQLQDALRAADDGFVTAMDLRKKLEEAFRGRLP